MLILICFSLFLYVFIKYVNVLHLQNIDFEGHVCLNILRDDWRPVMSLDCIVFGLLSLFLEPNPEDPLNKEAADLMLCNPVLFQDTVTNTMRGGSYFGKTFVSVLK